MRTLYCVCASTGLQLLGRRVFWLTCALTSTNERGPHRLDVVEATVSVVAQCNGCPIVQRWGQTGDELAERRDGLLGTFTNERHG